MQHCIFGAIFNNVNSCVSFRIVKKNKYLICICLIIRLNAQIIEKFNFIKLIKDK